MGAPENYCFSSSTIQEVVFEEGCEIIGGFGRCSELKKVTIPTTIKKLAGDGFCFCKQLSEVIIPESLERIDFGVSNTSSQGTLPLKALTSPILRFVFNPKNQQFDGTAIPLKLQVRLKKLGYPGSFGN